MKREGALSSSVKILTFKKIVRTGLLYISFALSIGIKPVSVVAQEQPNLEKIAQNITVRILGATEGSGVLIHKQEYLDDYTQLPPGIFQYKVISAWHVIKSNQKGEELFIVTPDGKRHRVNPSDTRRIRDLDLVTIRFRSSDLYSVATVSTEDLDEEDPLIVAGYPLSGQGRLTISRGQLFGEATFSLGGGYQVLYTNKTSAGMSGGPVLTTKGNLYAIHGQGETDMVKSEEKGVLVKTGINLGIPSFYQYLEDKTLPFIEDKDAKPSVPSDFVLLAKMQERRDPRQTKKIVQIYDRAVSFAKEWGESFTLEYAYMLRAMAKKNDGDFTGTLNDALMISKINPGSINATVSQALVGEAFARTGQMEKAYKTYLNMYHALNNPQKLKGSEFAALGEFQDMRRQITAIVGVAASLKKDHELAVYWFKKALAENPKSVLALQSLGRSLLKLDRKAEAIDALLAYTKIEPTDAWANFNLGKLLYESGKAEQSVKHLSIAIASDYSFNESVFYRARAFYDTSRYEEAIKDYSTLTRWASGSEDTSFYASLLAVRGFAYEKVRDWENACSDFIRSYSLGNLGIQMHAKNCEDQGVGINQRP